MFKSCLTATELYLLYEVKSVKLCGEISYPGCENFTEHVNTLSGQNRRVLVLQYVMHMYHGALND